MKSVRSSSTAVAGSNWSSRWLKTVFRQPQESPGFAVKVQDVELRRIGHLSTGPSDSLYTREEFRVIKRRLLSVIREGESPNGRNPRVIMVTSACPGDGKTFVATSIALSLAIERNVAVTMIDGDLTTRGLTNRFNLGLAAGLVDALDDNTLRIDDVLESSNLANFDIVPAGASRSDAPELLASSRMAQLINDLLSRSPNHIVVIDSGSLLSGSLPMSLAAYAGQIVFVLSSNETRRTHIEEALTLLDGAIGPLEEANLGLVLNRINPAQSAVRYSASSS